MNIGIVTPILETRYGGPASVVRSHLAALTSEDYSASLLAVCDHEGFAPLREEFPEAILCRREFPKKWSYSSELISAMRLFCRQVDVLHAHMLWDFPVLVAGLAAGASDLPFIVTPHGSVSAAWRRSALHKKFYSAVFLSAITSRIAFFQALNEAEADALSIMFPGCKVEIIPNGVSREILERQPDKTAALLRWPELKGRRIVLFLGRVWGEKGLDILPLAWHRVLKKVHASDCLLVVAGPDYRDYSASVSRAVLELGLQSSVLITGPVYGELKRSLFDAADVFVLPSASEGFSVAILEAMAARLPVVYTAQCNFPELEAVGAGVIAERTVAGVAEVLASFVSESESTLHAIGERGYTLCSERFSLDVVASMLRAAYLRASLAR
jgi:glycosyltransferase involved in cell wall biosynthesis